MSFDIHTPRDTDGKFAEKTGAAPDIALAAELPSVKSYAELERFDGEDSTPTHETQPFDLRAVLDTESLDDIELYIDDVAARESIFEKARDAGLVDIPAQASFTGRIDEIALEDYIDQRRARGLENNVSESVPLTPKRLQEIAGKALNLAHDEIPVLSVIDEDEGSERIRDQFRHAAAKLDGIDDHDGLSWSDHDAIVGLRDFVAESEDVNLNNVNDEREYRKKAIRVSAGLADWLLNRDFAYARAGN